MMRSPISSGLVARLTRSRVGSLFAGLAALAGACLSTSCGGGGESARRMVLVEFLFVDRGLRPTAPTEAQSLPRNAQLLMKFSEEVSAVSVTNQTIQIRSNNGQVPQGSFSINGSQVRFDPTITNQGQPNPRGFDSVTQYTVFIPSYKDDQIDLQISGVIENRDADPNTTTFRTAFETGAGWLRELTPPQVLGVSFIPDVNPLTGNTPGNGQLVVTFSEPMDEGSFLLGPTNTPLPLNTTIDIRYDPLAQINIDNSVANTSVPGYFTFDPSLTRAIFTPTFSFGTKKFVFYVQVFQGVRDLSGNLLVNPRTFGNYTNDGFGRASGRVLSEKFVTQTDRDGVSDALWGTTTAGTLQGQAVGSRLQAIYGFREASIPGNWGRGQYAAIPDPLTGAALNAVVAGINPPTNLGRRVMLAFSDTELGVSGTVTATHWGPDSNATFAALYQNIYLRMGYQAQNAMQLGTSMAGNYAGGQGSLLFNGDYLVAQVANVGNTLNPAHVPGYPENPGCQVGGWNAPLRFTGFSAWPPLTTYFDWDEGSTTVAGDSVLLWDMSVPEAATWQQFRAWFAATYPCSGVLIAGYPQRRLYTTYEADVANPTANVFAGILNSEPTVYDTAFTITKRVSIAQSLFYTYSTHPSQSPAGFTFGDLTDYLPVQLTPNVQSGGAQIRILFQGADQVLTDRRTIDTGFPFNPAFTTDINDCDGMRCVRWKVELISNLISFTVARLTQVAIPMLSL